MKGGDYTLSLQSDEFGRRKILIMSDDRRRRGFQPRNLNRNETSVALMGMAKTLALVFQRVDQEEELPGLKDYLIREAKNASIGGDRIDDETAIVDTIIDLIGMAFSFVEDSSD